MSQRGGGVQPAARHLFERFLFRAVANKHPAAHVFFAEQAFLFSRGGDERALCRRV